jgi:hypothetical protein
MYEGREQAAQAVREGFTKTFVPLSKDGVEYMHTDHDSVISDCPQCSQVTPGWELVLLLRSKGTPVGKPRHHYVVESREVDV